MRTVALAAVVAVSLLGAGCGSGHRTVTARYDYVWQAASRVSSGCARRDDPSSDVDGLIWLRGGSRPLVYYRNDGPQTPEILSSRGGHFPMWGEFWPCATPVAIYGRPPSATTDVTALAATRAGRRTIAMGRFRLAGAMNRNAPGGYGNAIVAANGRIIFFDATTIRYAGGSEFTVKGIPHGRQLFSLGVSPRDPSVFIANIVTNPGVPGGCRGTDVHGGVYLVTPSSTTLLRGYDPCTVGSINPEWSPDGRQLLWFLGNGLSISDGLGRHLHEILPRACGAVWSPNGREIAYGSTCNQVSVLDVATGRHRVVGTGAVRAWSPDGKQLALLRLNPPRSGPGFAGGSIVAVPVSGGPARLLIRLPATKS